MLSTWLISRNLKTYLASGPAPEKKKKKKKSQVVMLQSQLPEHLSTHSLDGLYPEVCLMPLAANDETEALRTVYSTP